jgi:NADP-dependent 3-hydroxy acid dehydrogenase YdfG
LRCEFLVHGVSESPREYLSAHDVRVIVISPGIIDAEAHSQVTDQRELAAYRANKAAIGDGIGADVVSQLMLEALPQCALGQEIG